MPNEQRIIATFVAIILIGGILLVGRLNAIDISNCIAAGHSDAVCVNTFNP